MEVASNLVRIRSASFEVTANMAYQLRPVARPLAAHGVGFHVLVYHPSGFNSGL